MFRISHLQRDCIGCDSCTELAPAYFRMNDDGIAVLRAPLKEETPWIHGEGFDGDRADVEEAAEACPMKIIEINR